MPRNVLIGAAAALLLAACGEDTGDAAEPEVDDPDDPEVEAGEEAVEPDEMPDADLFGIDFEGLWRLDEPTEAAIVVEPDAAVDDLVGELESDDGIDSVDVLDDAEIEKRGELEMLQEPGDPTPQVLLVTAEDHDTAESLAGTEDRDEVQHAFAPTCDALAGAARFHGVDQAEGWLDDAGCDDIAIIDADPDAAPSWVAATGVDGEHICLGTATAQAGMSSCAENHDDPGMPISSAAGGFVGGFVPAEADTVELDDGEQTVSVEAISVDEAAAAAYAAFMPDPDVDDEQDMTEARDVEDIDWRVLDADGDVIEEG